MSVPGNQNAAKGKDWRDAIRLALGRRGEGDYRKALADVAAKVVELAMGGDKDAWKEIGDRLDGKPAQAISGDPDAPPVALQIKWAKPD
jgi:hypothetical protein